MNRCFSLLILAIITLQVYANRKVITLNDNWNFRFSHQVSGSAVRVDIPHTWNATDALAGQLDYKRGIGNYEKSIFVPSEWRNKRIFIRFEGVNSIANLFVNGKHLGEHRGGYNAFIFELTNSLNYDQENTLLVRVNNAEQLDVMPLVGDFNFYGGIYRNVNLLITDSVCISPLDYASSGVYLTQQKVTKGSAQVEAKIVLSNASNAPQNVGIMLKVWDNDNLILEKQDTLNLPSTVQMVKSIALDIDKPHLWNGRKDPFMYRVQVMLTSQGKVIDEVHQPLGLRYYDIDPKLGFSFNGEYLKLKGVCRHQDRSEIGNALRNEHHEEDVQIMMEMGANSARLAHYPQGEFMYNLMDQNGFIVWAEIPFVGPGGYKDKGYVDLQSFKENGELQLVEMIRQNYNHPSICFWGIFNELKETGDNPIEYVKYLNEVAKKEDKTRPTTSASNRDGGLNFITDLIAWNKYDGWYGGMPENLGLWLDKTHAEYPDLKIGVSEYGAGASIYHHQDSLSKTDPGSMWHPENWQTFYHIENWKVLNKRKFVWGSYIWNLFDFGAAHRREGDRIGINDKGLVTFDRKIKKDAFYFYKANWNNSENTLYIADRRNTERKKDITDIIVFSSAPEVELFVNGNSQGISKVDDYATIVWKAVKLKKGQNKICVRSKRGAEILLDQCVWSLNSF